MSKGNASDQRNLLVAHGMPRFYEAARNGKIFTKCVGNGATFKAPLTAIPAIATAATWLLFNDNSVNGKTCLIPIRVSVFLASGTPAAGLGIALQVPKGAQARFTTDFTGVTESNSVGRSANSGAYLGNAKTMVGAQAAWDIFWNGDNTAAATILGAGHTVYLEGEYIVKPQHGMAIEVISGAGDTPLYGVSVTFIEAACDVE